MVREPEFHDIYHMVETIGPNYSEEPIPDEEKPACNHGQGGHAGERVGPKVTKGDNPEGISTKGCLLFCITTELVTPNWPLIDHSGS